jgi:hypothetical protein
MLFCFQTILFQSCSGPDPVDMRVITDTGGLRIDLEWTTGSSIAQSKIDVDLDLQLTKGTTVVSESLSYSGFEQVALSDLYADADYQLKIIVASAAKGSTYTVFVNGVSSGEIRQYESKTHTSDEGVTLEVLKITKLGTKYTLQQL